MVFDKSPKEQATIDFRERDLVFIDLETTGFDPTRHEIIEVGALLVDGKTLEIKKEYEAKVKPKHLETASKEALLVTHYSPPAWEKAKDLGEVLTDLNRLAPGGMVTGHNITFDWMFLELAYRKHRLPWAFDYHRLDVLSMAYVYVLADPKVKQLSLARLSEHFGISRKRAHRAMDDVRATYAIFKQIVSA